MGVSRRTRLRRCGALRRCRTGCWCSGRRSSDARHRAPTSVRQCQQRLALRARSDGEHGDGELVALATTVTADVMVTNFRSSPRSARPAMRGFGIRGDRERRLQRRADLAFRAHRLDRLVRDLADRAQALPLRDQRGVARFEVPEGLDEDRHRLAGREHLPRLLGGEAEEGRHPAQHGVRDVPQRGLRRAAREGLLAARVQAILRARRR